VKKLDPKSPGEIKKMMMMMKMMCGEFKG